MMTYVWLQFSVVCVLLCLSQHTSVVLADAASSEVYRVEGTLNSFVALQCRPKTYPKYDVDWRYAEGLETYQFRIYQTGVLYEAYSDRFRATNFTDEGLYVLNISRLRYNDTGFYFCVEKDGLGAKWNEWQVFRLNVTNASADVESTSVADRYASTSSSLTDASLPVTTEIPQTGPLSDGDNDSATSQPSHIVTIVVICALVAGSIVSLIVLFICWRRRHNNDADAQSDDVITLPELQPLAIPEREHVAVLVNGRQSPPTPNYPPVQCTDSPNDHILVCEGQGQAPDVIEGPSAAGVDNRDVGIVAETHVASNLQQLRKKLEYFIEFHGLMVHLKGLVSPAHVIELHRKRTVYEQISHLLDLVSDWNERDCQRFLTALDLSGQKHIANYIRRNGKMVSDSENEEQPLEDGILSALLTHIVSNDADISHLGRIVDELRNKKCITDNQKRYIDKADDLRQKHERLVEVLTRRSKADFSQFIELLRRHSNNILADQLIDEQDPVSSRDCVDCPQSSHSRPNNLQEALDETDFVEPEPEPVDPRLARLTCKRKDEDIFVTLRSRFPRLVEPAMTTDSMPDVLS